MLSRIKVVIDGQVYEEEGIGMEFVPRLEDRQKVADVESKPPSTAASPASSRGPEQQQVSSVTSLNYFFAPEEAPSLF